MNQDDTEPAEIDSSAETISEPGTTPGTYPFRQLRLNSYRHRAVRRWIFVYFLLLIFEGALRKWFFAGIPLISLPLSIVRDPVAMIIYFFAWRANVLRRKIRALCWLGLGGFLLLGIIQLVANPGLSFLVVLYGVRSYWLHIPLVFVIAEVLTEKDLFRIGRWLLLLAGPMTILMIAQFFAPPDSFLNRGMFDEGVGQIGAALGKIRPAETFSYNTGAGSFNLLVAAFLIYSFVDGRWILPWIRWIAAVALVAALPISGSRTFVLSSFLLVAFALVGGHSNTKLLKVALRTVAIGGAIFFLLTFTSFFQQGIETFTARWNETLDATATGSVKESIVMRFFGEFIRAFQLLGNTPVLGHGIGLGSNFGAAMAAGGLGFLLAETEWERTVLEMGPLAAVLWLGVRCGFGFFIVRQAWSCLRRGHVLAWLLFGTECVAFFNGSTAQPTQLGFVVVTTGLCLAAIKSVKRGDSLPASNGKKARRQISYPAVGLASADMLRDRS
jgi:hypothetical protein